MPKRRLKGKVVSDKMEKTVVVAVERVFGHPIYRKKVKVTWRFKAHDESGTKVGDEVTIEETRPLSGQKKWRVIEVGGRKVVEEPKVEKVTKKEEKSEVKRRKNEPKNDSEGDNFKDRR